jgi:hypothetical protein
MRIAVISTLFVAMLLLAFAALPTTPAAGETVPPVNGVPTYCEAWSAVSLGEVQVCIFIPQVRQSVLIPPEQLEPGW